jgi:hypothetical protein
LQDQGEMTAHVDAATSSLRDRAARWRGTYVELVGAVGTRSACMAFLHKTGFSFGRPVEVLNYLLRWVLCFKTAIGEFVDVGEPTGR